MERLQLLSQALSSEEPISDILATLGSDTLVRQLAEVLIPLHSISVCPQVGDEAVTAEHYRAAQQALVTFDLLLIKEYLSPSNLAVAYASTFLESLVFSEADQHAAQYAPANFRRDPASI